MIVIYKITSPSNKIYIGQTWNWIKRKSNYKKLQCRGQIKLYNSLKKYGFENHILEVILTFDNAISQPDLDNYEIYWWKYYKELGFNMLNIKEPGSHGKHSDESKVKMSISQKLRNIKLSKSHKEALIQSNIGRKKSEEEKTKISKGNKGKIRTKENKEKIKYSLLKLGLYIKPVLMLDKNENVIEEFRNVKTISTIKGWDTRHIRKILKDGKGTARGFKWKYKNQEL